MSAPPAERPVFPASPHSPLGPFLRTARPRQWIKNLLVLAAPAASGALVRPAAALATGIAILAFTCAAIATYFINDAADVSADRRHPLKSRRPIAAGMIGVRTARLTGLATAVAAIALAGTTGWACTLCITGYLLLTGAYSAGLKHVPVLDVLVVAAGFLLRVAAGAAATGASVSSWFMLLILFGALYLITAKRIGELSRPWRGTRQVLTGYSAGWLQQTLTMALTGTVLAYAAWAFQYLGGDVMLPLLAASLGPFLAALMRYSLLVARGDGETPENLLTSDPFLLVAGAVWASSAGTAIYLG
jgi:decaprenyl-phosphate phosphoribosyltransferase